MHCIYFNANNVNLKLFEAVCITCVLFMQIARQDNKKERKHQKEIKNQIDAQATNSKLFREMVLVLFTLLTIFLVVYAFLYLSVQNGNRDRE